MFKKMHSKSKGFSLIELIVVIAIIGVLVMLAAPKLMGFTERAQEARIQSDVKVMEGKIAEQYMDSGYDFDGDVDGSVIDDMIGEKTVYSIKGKVAKGSIPNIKYKEIEAPIVKDSRTKLDGTFYADAEGNVYYVDNKAYKADTEVPDIETVIGEAESLNPDDYENFTEVNQALENANNVKNDENSTQEDIDNATKDLDEAINDLVPKGGSVGSCPTTGYVPVAITDTIKNNAPETNIPDPENPEDNINLFNFSTFLASMPDAPDNFEYNVSYFNEEGSGDNYVLIYIGIEEMENYMFASENNIIGVLMALMSKSIHSLEVDEYAIFSSDGQTDFGKLSRPTHIPSYDKEGNITGCTKIPTLLSLIIEDIENNEYFNPENFVDFTEFQNALDNAKVVNNDENSTQEDIDNAIADLIAARDNLVLKSEHDENGCEVVDFKGMEPMPLPVDFNPTTTLIGIGEFVQQIVGPYPQLPLDSLVQFVKSEFNPAFANAGTDTYYKYKDEVTNETYYMSKSVIGDNVVYAVARTQVDTFDDLLILLVNGNNVEGFDGNVDLFPEYIQESEEGNLVNCPVKIANYYFEVMDKSDLIAKINEANNLNPNDYVDFTEVDNAISNGEIVKDDQTATQDEINDAITDIDNAINALFIRVSTIQDLVDINSNLDAKYMQVNDIDMTGITDFIPIGVDYDNSFTGTYNGANYKITNLTIDRSNQNNVGLFGYTDGATIENIGLKNIDFTGRDRVGGLVGSNHNSTITNSYTSGSVTGTYWHLGGLVGWNENSTITNSYASVNVEGTGTRSVGGSSSYVGGLAGYNYNNSTIINSYASGSVIGINGSHVGGLVGNNYNSTIENSYASGSAEGSEQIGGLAGYNYHNSTIINSYASGSVSGNNRLGGLVGVNKDSLVENSYAIGNVEGTDRAGGLVGLNENSVASNSYYNKETSGQTTSNGGTGKTTAQMKQEDSYQNWNFDTIWQIDEGITYPTLR